MKINIMSLIEDNFYLTFQFSLENTARRVPLVLGLNVFFDCQDVQGKKHCAPNAVESCVENIAKEGWICRVDCQGLEMLPKHWPWGQHYSWTNDSCEKTEIEIWYSTLILRSHQTNYPARKTCILYRWSVDERDVLAWEVRVESPQCQPVLDGTFWRVERKFTYGQCVHDRIFPLHDRIHAKHMRPLVFYQCPPYTPTHP